MSTLASAGNLVFQGTADGRFMAFNARTGEKLWEAHVGTGVVAAPATYMVDGKQYVSVAVGWGGAFGVNNRATNRRSPGTVYTYQVRANGPGGVSGWSNAAGGTTPAAPPVAPTGLTAKTLSASTAT